MSLGNIPLKVCYFFQGGNTTKLGFDVWAVMRVLVMTGTPMSDCFSGSWTYRSSGLHPAFPLVSSLLHREWERKGGSPWSDRLPPFTFTTSCACRQIAASKIASLLGWPMDYPMESHSMSDPCVSCLTFSSGQSACESAFPAPYSDCHHRGK